MNFTLKKKNIRTSLARKGKASPQAFRRFLRTMECLGLANCPKIPPITQISAGLDFCCGWKLIKFSLWVCFTSFLKQIHFILMAPLKKQTETAFMNSIRKYLQQNNIKKNRARTRINMKTGRCKMSFFFDLAGCWKLVYTGNGAIFKTLRLKIWTNP